MLGIEMSSDLLSTVWIVRWFVIHKVVKHCRFKNSYIDVDEEK